MQKKTVTIIAIVIAAGAALFLLLQLVPGPGMTNPPVTGEPPWDSPETRALAKRACYDCHSNRTHWPWYSRVAPISWLLAHDVSEGRGNLNLSLWAEYPAARQLHLAAEIADEVDSGGMPLPMYLWLHTNARLGPADREQVRIWAGSFSAAPARGESESK